MNALLRGPTVSLNPQALALVVLSLHGTVVLFHQQMFWWQLVLLTIMLVLGIGHLFKQSFIKVSLELEFFLALAITFVLMVSTGGTGSFFLAWLFVLALYYPVQINTPLGKWLAPLIGFSYLLLIPFSPTAVPLALVLARALLITTIGWSIYDLGKKLRQANETREITVEDLRSSEQRLRNLVETIPGITYIGARDRTLFMSPQIEILLGYTPQEFIDDKKFWKKCIHPDDLEAVLAEMYRTYAPDEVFACEYRMLAKDGRVVWFQDEAKIRRDAEGYMQELQGVMLEITERKAYEAQLGYQASLVDNLFDAVVSTDTEFRIVSMNKAAEQLYGYTQTEVVGKTVGEVLKNKYPTATKESLLQEFLTEGSWRGEATQVNKAGERIPILSSVSKVFDKDGNYLGAVAINKDMREMKRAQLELQESESRYRELLEQAAEGILVSNQDLQLILVNQALCELLGNTREELLQVKLLDLIHPEDNLEEAHLQLEAIGRGKVVKSEHLLRRKDGSSVLVEGSAKRLPDGNLQFIMHDISERKRAEETLKQTEAFYRAITEKSYEGIAIVDKDYIVRYRSSSNTSLSGYSDDQRIGQPYSFFVHPDDRERALQALEQLPLNQSCLLELRLMLAQNEWRWIEVRLTNLLEYPAIKGYVINARDISERKRAEEAQRELSHHLMTVQETERRSLARELHDEIGQSLTTIKVRLQAVQHFQEMDALEDALQLTDTLLTQVQELSLNLHPQVLEDLGLSAALRWYVLRQAQRSGIEITFDGCVNEKIAPQLEVTIYRIAQEGLTNIIRHSQARHVHVSLTAQNNEIVLGMKDDGFGFDVQTQQQSRKSLGLLSMRERAALHGGHLELHSEVGRGTKLIATFQSTGGLGENTHSASG